MYRKLVATAFIIVLFLVLSFSIIFIISELCNGEEVPIVKVSEAQRFKEEFERNNDTLRSVDIPMNNNMVVKSLKEVNDLIDSKESFILFVGNPEDNLSRVIVEELVSIGLNQNVKKFYYVNISKENTEYALNDNHKLVKSKEGSEEYYRFLNNANDILDNYPSLYYQVKKNKYKEVKIDEKTVDSPSLYVVKNGKFIAKDSGIFTSITDLNMELTKEVKCEMEERFVCLFNKINDEVTSCDTENICSIN